MKKLLALLAVLAMLFTSTFALAEEEAIEEFVYPFEATELLFEDYGFSIVLPSDWDVYEIDEAAAEAGIFFIAASTDGANTVQIVYTELEEAVASVEDLVAALSTEYEGVEAIEINGAEFAVATLVEEDINMMATLSQDGSAMYMFFFTSASDEAFHDISVAIAASITPVDTTAVEE